ncbi:MAG: tRNA (adenosine(37)-N6)-threonylcarbamoyltransferase complex dimerization subunit type 1 TsaB [Gammaproteobacteria bacterium]|nr:tRNA (adenosine(37)-N6)-threonylcarbamoyltransferase complex dimerization subunit type 1 TsaB [Gammaproteobacteria bacterium]MCW8909286.1 tRNA (adenosine(37)-N6)-threonylcarbamoyltransferase complex dimerization subunit type 1 TsaB [Gammaproteobacteria bacterium]MCW9003941.1 tRNA (adenosine(37)-N6)-threonylcarbamoyltransferase complex dimerization subunit type 1 TsaB [Gammaproteobacteria bacterium]MCW9057117.1 tRNA (adenosine(37)-N6)-threonylcarbamoyltransferase complex dimerization subunit t
MKLLALDTSTEACSAALYIDGEIDQRFELAPREHTQLILPMVDNLLSTAGINIKQLDGLAFGRGPGSFTGVRISTGIIQGMAFGADLPVVPVSTLASIAQAVYEDHQHSHVLAGIDARMGEVYWSQYTEQDGIMLLTGEEAVISPEQVTAQAGVDWVAAGSAWASYSDVLLNQLGTDIKHQYPSYHPQSRTIARLAADAFNKGAAFPAEQAIPVYLRNNVAKKSTKIK